MHDRMYGSDRRVDADWRVIKQLWPFLLSFKGRVLLAMALLIGAKIANVWVPIALKYIIDALDPSVQGGSDTQGQLNALITLPLALLLGYGVLRFSSVFFSELRDAVFGRVAERTLSNVALSVFEHLHKLDLEFHLSRRTGGLTRDIERGTTGISFLLRSVVFSVVPILIEVALVAAVLFVKFDPIFAFVTVASVVGYVLFSVWVTEWRTEFVRTANLKDSAANSKAIDSLLNFETVKYFNNESYEANRYADSLAERENAKVKNHLSLATLNSGQALIIGGSITLMMVLAAQRVVDGEMTLGDLAMVNAFMIQVFIPLNVLGFVYREIKRCLADVESMFKLLNATPRIQDAPDAEALPEKADGITFDHVDFAYHEDRPILRNVNFVVHPGEKVAIVGPSGAGKSTIARLLFRFYEPQQGAIYIGERNIAKVTQESLRRALGVVPQDTVLFNDTLLENIRYGRPDATQEEVEAAVEHAYLKSFIKSLPKGYDTQVGERGLKVSGGEKQRIAIARTILKNPRIMIFDEATSSLDSESEKAILKALNKIAARKTTVVIAHRLSTIVDADRILVLKEGKIVEQGNHAQLMEKKGDYARLWQMQQHEETDE
ncbi:MAG: ABC transporter ATP-binding protein/permease [Ketobacteraceae bacterium]|nr:ABC transporter ATP-binding protein/permease [Ketobacteraceae bacterium]